MHGVAPQCKVSFHMLNLIESARGYTPVAWNVSGNFAFFMGAEEALRSVLLTDFTALKSFACHEPVTSTASQCDYCRNKLGPSPHSYWRMRFCSLACMAAYQQRLSPQTREKIVMLEPNDFFQNQVKQCRSQAESAANKRDSEFWLQLADRWERLLRAGSAGIEVTKSPVSSVRCSERSQNNSQNGEPPNRRPWCRGGTHLIIRLI